MYHRILVPVDGSEPAHRGLDEAVRLALAWNATIRLLHVRCAAVDLEPPEGGIPVGHRQSLAERAHHVLDQARHRAERPGLTIEIQQRELERGRLAAAIVDEAASGKCDLIVMGTHGRPGLERSRVASHAEDLVRSSPVPVLVVRWSKERRRPSPSTSKTDSRHLPEPAPTT